MSIKVRNVDFITLQRAGLLKRAHIHCILYRYEMMSWFTQLFKTLIGQKREAFHFFHGLFCCTVMAFCWDQKAINQSVQEPIYGLLQNLLLLVLYFGGNISMSMMTHRPMKRSMERQGSFQANDVLQRPLRPLKPPWGVFPRGLFFTIRKTGKLHLCALCL